MAHHHTLPRSHPSSIIKHRRRYPWRLWKLLLPISPLLLPIAWIGYREVENTWIQPQVIFVLGGEEEREIFGAKFAHKHPNLPVWISSGAPPGYAKRVFKKAGVSAENLHLDYQAIDTVTNFTTLVDRFESKGITSVYLVTSDDHMRRARSIGEIVFGSRGIKVKPVTFVSGRPTEPIQKTVRDSFRSLLWIATGYAGGK
ncbi:YdcF family protein [Chamaesiphon sp. VAR_48_metabat_135_sub]|uniref:YdcF family protein n=1 Tax=Chamaesiphon sp. VAR_48_metabat_135_sub TaxID=2964699 RepID=UPI00286C57CF|nr:YdcF family protein [Chamaesiphon sp. VAR_48_metabat_135_sub]